MIHVVHCIRDEIAKHCADHRGVGYVGEHAVAGSAHLQQQRLRWRVSGARGNGRVKQGAKGFKRGFQL